MTQQNEMLAKPEAEHIVELTYNDGEFVRFDCVKHDNCGYFDWSRLDGPAWFGGWKWR